MFIQRKSIKPLNHKPPTRYVASRQHLGNKIKVHDMNIYRSQRYLEELSMHLFKSIDFYYIGINARGNHITSCDFWGYTFDEKIQKASLL